MKLNQAIVLLQHTHLISHHPQVWADLGCGTGLFTQALAQLLYTGSTLYAVDKDAGSLRSIPPVDDSIIKTLQADFITDSLHLPAVDGILMANSLHFVQDKPAFIQKMRFGFRAEPCFLIVEYDTDLPNAWVPYPLGFSSLQRLFEKEGYSFIEKINELPSRYNRANIYSVLIKK